MTGEQPRYYWLDGRDVRPTSREEAVCQWDAGIGRIVGRDTIGDAVVSTAFLIFDHASSGPPVLFETMVFWDGADLDGYQARYSTYDEAEAGHRRMVERVMALRELRRTACE